MRVVSQTVRRLGDGGAVEVRMVLVPKVAGEANGAATGAGHCKLAAAPCPMAAHADDFLDIDWFGQRYTFTESQAAVVERLWLAWRSGNCEVPAVELEKAAGGKRLASLFRGHPAWGTLIRKGETRGAYRLDVDG